MPEDASSKPNIIVILVDDMGYSDIGCFGSEIRTPNLDSLAEGGLRFSQMYNSARCCPSRAALLTGLNPHQAGIGHMVANLGVPEYQGYLKENAVTIAEALRADGYSTYMSGKWHVGGDYNLADPDSWTPSAPTHPTPTQRGFDRYFGILTGAGNFYFPKTLMDQDTLVPLADLEDFYLTDAISDNAVSMIGEAVAQDSPFFMYVAYTAPHWPLHAPEEDIARYEGQYRGGWEELRTGRHEKLKSEGVVDEKWEISPRDSDSPPWDEVTEPDWQDIRMAVYAAQVDRVDQGVGRILAALRSAGAYDNTLIMFLSDNGGCAEFLAEDGSLPQPARYGGVSPDGTPVVVGNIPGLRPGGPQTFMSYDLPWANASNTPFRRFKRWTHEGGISTPFILSWPARIREPGIVHSPVHLIDIMPTCLDAAGARHPYRACRAADHSARRREYAARDRASRMGARASDSLGARGQQGGETGSVEARVRDRRRMGAVRHGTRPDGVGRPLRSKSLQGPGAGETLRRVGRTLRRPAVVRNKPRLEPADARPEHPSIRLKSETRGPQCSSPK